MDLLIAPQLGACTYGFSLVDERVDSLLLHAGERAHPAFLESLAGVLESALLLLGDFNARVDNDSGIWRSVNGLKWPYISIFPQILKSLRVQVNLWSQES